jgi:hypothetical protein
LLEEFGERDAERAPEDGPAGAPHGRKVTRAGERAEPPPPAGSSLAPLVGGYPTTI